MTGSERTKASDAPTLDVAKRLDRLPWSRWHWRVVIALGVAWVLDGLEVTLVGSLGAVLQRQDTLGLSPVQIGLCASLYLAGAIAGALVFGRLTDRLGRKKLFLATLVVYTAATFATAFSTGLWTFGLFRFCTGLGIGGEYAAINSAIDELIPARVRGRVNLAINSSFWIGAALGAGASVVLLDPRVLGPVWGWRAAFALGAVLAVSIVLVRRHVPESPRWLAMHGRGAEARDILARIESEAWGGADRRGEAGSRAASAPSPAYEARTALPEPPAARALPSVRDMMAFLWHRVRSRTIVALALMISQAFFYNAIFFSYSLVLTRFHGVSESRVGLYIFPFAAGNVLGPILLGPLFDRIGRRRMIGFTYAVSGIGLALTGVAFMAGLLDAVTQALAWSAVFFFASAAASSAYLTISEIFPLEMRAFAISVFYAVGTAAGGFAAPLLFGALIGSGSVGAVASGYGVGAVLMVVAGVLAWRYGVNAERKPLEEVAPGWRHGARP